MVRSRNRRLERIGERHFKEISIGIVSLFLLVCGSILSFVLLQTPKYSYGVVVYGDPIQTYWIDKFNDSVSILSVPGSAHNENDTIYSAYPLSAFSSLGKLNQSQLLPVRSINFLLALPVQWYVSPQIENSERTKDQNPRLSFMDGMHILFGNRQSSIPFLYRIDFVKTILFFDHQKIKTYDLTDQYYINSIPAADGSMVPYLISDRIDMLLKHDFESVLIRKEGFRIQIINANGKPGVGDSLSKIMSRIGMNVGSVDTGAVSQEQCAVSASEKTLASVTAKYLSWVFHCQTKKQHDTTAYDIIFMATENTFPYKKELSGK